MYWFCSLTRLSIKSSYHRGCHSDSVILTSLLTQHFSFRSTDECLRIWLKLLSLCGNCLLINRPIIDDQWLLSQATSVPICPFVLSSLMPSLFSSFHSSQSTVKSSTPYLFNPVIRQLPHLPNVSWMWSCVESDMLIKTVVNQMEADTADEQKHYFIVFFNIFNNLYF